MSNVIYGPFAKSFSEEERVLWSAINRFLMTHAEVPKSEDGEIDINRVIKHMIFYLSACHAIDEAGEPTATFNMLDAIKSELSQARKQKSEEA